MMKRMLRFLGLVGLAVVGTVPSLTAQACFGPDGLDGPCCTFVTEDLPTFPDLSMQGSALPWQDCMPLPKLGVAMSLGGPQQLACGSYVSPFSVTTAAGIVVASGELELTYSRTWDEISPAGQVHQVWRFLIMGNLDVAPTPVPQPAIPPVSPAFYHGYIDYALPCNAPLVTWRHAMVLFHNCDDFLHRPGLSANPGVFHPDRTFAFVSPDTAAQPFDHTVIAPPMSGPVMMGALRDPSPAAIAACTTRDRVAQGALDPIVEGCACPLTVNLPPRNVATRMSAFGVCGGGTLSLDTSALGFPWLHLISTSIGRWTNGAVFPGEEGALVYEGPVVWQEGCTNQRFAELHYGAATQQGWTRVSPLPVLLPQNMLDMRSNWSIPIPGPVALPIVGAVFPSPFRRHVLFLDTM